jgi:hypothetical protein
MMKSLSLVHQTQIKYLGSADATLLTDIAPIIFFGSLLFLLIFSLAIFLVMVFVIDQPFLSSAATTRALTTTPVLDHAQNFEFFFFSPSQFLFPGRLQIFLW